MVLCAADGEECFAYAKQRGLVLMEAMKPVFLPTTFMARQWIYEGKIGKLNYIQASYCHGEETWFHHGWHQDPKLGGGVLYDIGVYPIGFVHALLPQMPIHISCDTRYLENGCDSFHAIHARYEDVYVHMLCACDTPMENEALIIGTKGSIRIADFWKSERAVLHNEQGIHVFEEPHDRSEFRYEIESFCDAILAKAKSHGIVNEDVSLRNALLIDIIHKNAETGEDNG